MVHEVQIQPVRGDRSGWRGRELAGDDAARVMRQRLAMVLGFAIQMKAALHLQHFNEEGWWVDRSSWSQRQEQRQSQGDGEQRVISKSKRPD